MSAAAIAIDAAMTTSTKPRRQMDDPERGQRLSVTLWATVNAVTIFTTLTSAGMKSAISRHRPCFRTSTAGRSSAIEEHHVVEAHPDVIGAEAHDGQKAAQTAAGRERRIPCGGRRD